MRGKLFAAGAATALTLIAAALIGGRYQAAGALNGPDRRTMALRR